MPSPSVDWQVPYPEAEPLQPGIVTRVTTVTAITPLTDFSVWARGSGLEVILFVIGAMLAVRLAGWIRDRATSRIDASSRDQDADVASEKTKHRHALAGIITWIATVLIWAVALALVLDRFGVPFSSLAAPLVAGGLGLGLGAQRLVQDLIGGGLIISERQYGFGDLVQISATTETDGATGTVEDLTLRVTRLRTPEGELVVIANGQILQVANRSSGWARATVDVPLPAGADVTQANQVLRDVCSAAFDDDELKPLLLDAPTVLGVESFEGGRVNLRMVARTEPGKQFEVARDLRVRVAEAFQREGIVGSAEHTPVKTATDA